MTKSTKKPKVCKNFNHYFLKDPKSIKNKGSFLKDLSDTTKVDRQDLELHFCSISGGRFKND